VGEDVGLGLVVFEAAIEEPVVLDDDEVQVTSGAVHIQGWIESSQATADPKLGKPFIGILLATGTAIPLVGQRPSDRPGCLY
jgi:hypothetical protein